jgi:hypothetical protein
MASTNNIFRMLPPAVMTMIKAMNSDKHAPTPSALAIQEAGLVLSTPIDRHPYMVAEVATTPPAYFTAWGEDTDYLEIYITPSPMNPALGVVRTNTWIRLRRNHSFEDALDYMQTLANDHPGFF